MSAVLEPLASARKTYDGPIFDGDTHIQEKDFSFMEEYLPKQYHAKWLPKRKVGPSGRFNLHVGDRIVENAESNEKGLVPPPGKLKEWLRAMKEGGSRDIGWVEPTPDFYTPAERLKTLDRFGVEGSMMFPGEFIATVGYYTEDPLAGNAVLHAYNRYLKDVWSFNLQDRIYPAAFLTLWDLETSLKEAEWLIENGVRMVTMPMGPSNNRSPADPYFDPIWSRLNEAGVRVTYHVAEATFMHPMIRSWGEKELQNRRTGQTAWQWMFAYSEVPVQMQLANLVLWNFFERYPNIKVASVENGASWLPKFLEKMDKMRGMTKNGFWPGGQLKSRASEVFKRSCFVVAYPEDDVKSIVEEIGTAECLLMGSDYPHAEGVPTPQDFYREALTELPDDQVRQIMHDNGRRFLPRSN
jgi:predicted TIM-barrel fold metal-dependent hydrolase